MTHPQQIKPARPFTTVGDCFLSIKRSYITPIKNEFAKFTGGKSITY